MHYNQIMTEAVSPTRQAAEQEVERPVIWNVVTIMWGHCNNNATKGGFGITNEIVEVAFAISQDLLLNE